MSGGTKIGKAVKEADVLLVGPGPVAVTIRYDFATMCAPMVTCKGRGAVAGLMERLAQSHSIPVQDASGCVWQFETLEEGEEIPHSLFDFVAAALGAAFKAGAKRRRRKTMERRTSKRKGAKRPVPFSSSDEILGAALDMFLARHDLPAGRKKVAAMHTERWHRSFAATPDSVHLRAELAKHRLTRLETELVVGLILLDLGLVPSEMDRYLMNLAEFVALTGLEKLQARRALAEDGRLHDLGLIWGGGRSHHVSAPLLKALSCGDGSLKAGWLVESEADLYRKLRLLTVACSRKARAMLNSADEHSCDDTPLGSALHEDLPHRSDFAYDAHCEIAYLSTRLSLTLAEHPEWHLRSLLDYNGLGQEPAQQAMRLILLTLLGRELAHLPAEAPLFTGGGLAMAATDLEPMAGARPAESLRLLTTNGFLVQQGLIQPCGGNHMLLNETPETLAEVKFELTEKSLEILGRERDAAQRRLFQAGSVRSAKVRMEQLVLSERTRKALDMALAQARHSAVLMTAWGLNDVLSYGKGVTLLFSGPPGVGKTACAEAIASELGCPILVADYSRVQNCLVGMTEKNVVRTFREAGMYNAVLFWDEADAMFYNREAASQTWEVREVNVLLQELEKFSGVCILATNRKVSLDPALDRRISMKIEFERPDRAMRRRIWERMIPRKLPMATDVSLDALAGELLSGGEIKNVVLNAARLALARSMDGPVGIADFRAALAMETTGRWGEPCQGKIGFRGAAERMEGTQA